MCVKLLILLKIFKNRQANVRACYRSEFAGDYGADVVEFGKCFERGEVVDVYAKYLVAHLFEHGVVEFEE